MTRPRPCRRSRAGSSEPSRTRSTTSSCGSRTGRPGSSYPAATPLPVCAGSPCSIGGKCSRTSAGWSGYCAAIRPGSMPGWISPPATAAGGRSRSSPWHHPAPRNRSRKRSSSWRAGPAARPTSMTIAAMSAPGWSARAGPNWPGCWPAARRAVTGCWPGSMTTTRSSICQRSAAFPCCWRCRLRPSP